MYFFALGAFSFSFPTVIFQKVELQSRSLLSGWGVGGRYYRSFTVALLILEEKLNAVTQVFCGDSDDCVTERVARVSCPPLLTNKSGRSSLAPRGCDLFAEHQEWRPLGLTETGLNVIGCWAFWSLGMIVPLVMQATFLQTPALLCHLYNMLIVYV